MLQKSKSTQRKEGTADETSSVTFNVVDFIYGVPGFDSVVVGCQERTRKLIGEKIIQLIPMGRFQEAA